MTRLRRANSSEHTMYKSLLIVAILALSLVAFATETPAGPGSEQAIGQLIQGNLRYVSEQPQAWSAAAPKRELLSKGQHPAACIITCSDSRVPPEILFDQSIGDLFVVRLAGNVITPEAVGSVEYAVEHLHVPVVVVLGHSSCGAVNAALSGAKVPGSIGTLTSRIQPAIDIARHKGVSDADLPHAVVEENARCGIKNLLTSSSLIADAVTEGHVSLISGVYELTSGKVDWQIVMQKPLLPAATVVDPAVVLPPESHADRHQQQDKPKRDPIGSVSRDPKH